MANPFKAALSPAQVSRAKTQLRRENLELREMHEKGKPLPKERVKQHLHRVNKLKKGR